MNTFPRETVEFLPLTVLDGETPVTTFQVAVTAHVPGLDVQARPTAWTANTTLDGEHGVMVTGLTPGVYSLWSKTTANPEAPVLHHGWFVVT